MEFDHLSTELLAEILSYSVREWSQEWLLDSKRSNSAYQDLRRHQDVCASWRLIIDHQMLAEINRWEAPLFYQKILHAAEWGHAVFISLAYSSKEAHLLGSATLGRNPIVPLEYAALAEAARHDRHAVVKVLISKGLDLNAVHVKSKESCTRSDRRTTMSKKQTLKFNPLHNSVAWGNFKTAQLLLENGADPNARIYRWGRTTLFDVVGSSDDKVNASSGGGLDAGKRIAMTRLLLDYGGDLNIRSSRNESILYAAACGGHTEIIELLLEAGACNLLEDSTQADGFTPLMAASCAKHGAITRILLEKGADCTTHTANGLDALALAVELESPKIDPTSTIEALLEYGADVNGSGQPISPLSWAVYSHNFIGVRLLLRAGADANRVDSQGATPLEIWLSMRPGRLLNKISLAILRELLENGADVNWPMSNGSTLLIEACSPHGSYEHMRLPAIKELLQHGADVNGRNHNGDTPLITLCSTKSLGEAQQIRIISELIKYKVDIESVNQQGDTALMKAIHSIDQDMRIVGILLTWGANINNTNARGDTPLMTLCANTTLPLFWRLELLALLSRHGANLNHINLRGDSALIKALGCQGFLFIKALIRTNVNVNQANGDGVTPLMLTCKSKLSVLEKVEIMESLLVKGARIKEVAFPEMIETFILDVEGRDRTLGSVLRTMIQK